MAKSLVNLDAMIEREDFASAHEVPTYETVSTISVRDFTSSGIMGPSLRKPDFQRETNHWSPEQVVSFLECFVNGDLIPSVILWKSPAFIFVIDGGHRLSALKAWVEDDYGDGAKSQSYFGYSIPAEQVRIATNTRNLVNRRVGSWQQFQTKIQTKDLDHQERIKINTITSRAIQIQWVNGDADKAESSFFKINTKGTPLDDIEELLLQNRKKPIAIAARAIIRSGKGHRYWSSFDDDKREAIESLSSEIHKLLFDPEVKQPVKSLDLPLGGPKTIRGAIQELIDLALVAYRNQAGEPKKISEIIDDSDGTETIRVLNKTYSLARRMTGNGDGSLGLHPAIYFYGPTGRHITAMFMGTAMLFASKIINNDSMFFKKFTSVRARLEKILIESKELISMIISKTTNSKRPQQYAKFLDSLVLRLLENSNDVSDKELIELAELEGKIFLADFKHSSSTFSDETKSEVFIASALKHALKCSFCKGYLIVEKSVSYDHITPLRSGGLGGVTNCQLLHPYCNQSGKQ